MNVKDAINNRRAIRSLNPINIKESLIYDLAECARLSASCFNYQPWKYIFVYDKITLKNMGEALSSGNEWAKQASMIIVVFSNKEDDCIIGNRYYYLFDTGMSTAFLILRATELGLVAHPIAGYKPSVVKKILNIPEEFNVISLIIIGKHSKKINPILSDKQKEAEKIRPERKKFDDFIYINNFKNKK